MAGRLLKRDYMPHAPSSPGTVRVNHEDCPAGTDTRRRLYVTRKEDYNVIAYCHNCSLGGGSRGTHRYRTAGIPDALPKEPEKVDMSGEQFTDDPRKWPFAMEDWLRSMGMDLTYAKECGIVYDTIERRICIPKFDREGELVQYQSRRLFDDGTPKYLTYKEKDKFIHDPVRGRKYMPKNNTCIVVEDMISALRCAKLGYDAVPLFTSTMDERTRLTIANQYGTILVWLDNDNPTVRNHANHIGRALKMLDPRTRVEVVHNIREPKLFKDNEIDDIVSSLCHKEDDR